MSEDSPEPAFERSACGQFRQRSAGLLAYDLIDDALHQLAERRGQWLGDPIAAITLLASLIDQAERMLPELVLEARDHGATWHDIATALATSPEQAELAYSPGSPVADTRWPYNI